MSPTWARLVLAGLLLAGCQSGSPSQAPLVSAVTVRSGKMPHTLFVTGELRARRQATLSTTRAGIVERITVVEGDHVRQHQPLVYLHHEALTSQVEQKTAVVAGAEAKVAGLKANLGFTGVKNVREVQQSQESLRQAMIAIDQSEKELANAQKDMSRKKQLLAEKSVALVDYERAELTWKEKQDSLEAAKSKARAAQVALRLAQEGKANEEVQRTDLASAQANLEQARTDLKASKAELAATVLRSPITGVVVGCKVQNGQTLGGGGEAVLTVVDNSRLDLYVTVAQSDAGLMTPHMTAVLETDLVPGESFPISLVELIPASDPRTNTVRARFALVKPHPRLLHGAKVRVRATLHAESGLLLDRDCVRADHQGHCFVRGVRSDTGQIVHLPVTVLRQSESEVLIKDHEAVKDGDHVVVSGGETLPDGTVVSIRTPTY